MELRKNWRKLTTALSRLWHREAGPMNWKNPVRVTAYIGWEIFNGGGNCQEQLTGPDAIPDPFTHQESRAVHFHADCLPIHLGQTVRWLARVLTNRMDIDLPAPIVHDFGPLSDGVDFHVRLVLITRMPEWGVSAAFLGLYDSLQSRDNPLIISHSFSFLALLAAAFHEWL